MSIAGGAYSKQGAPLNRSWHESLDPRRVPLAGLITAAAAAALNAGVREAAGRWLGIPTDQPVLSLAVVLGATCTGVFLACLALVALGQTQARPFTIFRRLAWIVFLLSSGAALLAYLGWLPRVASLTYGTLLLLVGMNVLTTACCVGFLTTMPASRSYGHF